MAKKKKQITGYMLAYSDDVGNALYFAEGRGGVEYAVLDAFYKNKRVFDVIPNAMNRKIRKVRITLEDITDN